MRFRLALAGFAAAAFVLFVWSYETVERPDGLSSDSIDAVVKVAHLEGPPTELVTTEPGFTTVDLLSAAGNTVRAPVPGNWLVLEVDGIGDDEGVARFLTRDGVVVSENVQNGRVRQPLVEWTDVVISYSSGEKLYRQGASVIVEADGSSRIRGSFGERHLPLVWKGHDVDGLAATISAVQELPIPPAPLALASDWSSGVQCALVDSALLTLPIDSSADSIRLSIERPFAISTENGGPGKHVLLSDDSPCERLRIWWPSLIRCRLVLPNSPFGRAPEFEVQWEFLDFDRQLVQRARRRLRPGETYPIAAPVESAFVVLQVFDGAATPVARAQGEVRSDRLFELRLDDRQVSFIVTDRGGGSVSGVSLRSGGETLSRTDANGAASVKRHSVTQHGLQLRHPNYDTELIRAAELDEHAELGAVCRIILSSASALRVKSTGSAPDTFVVGVSHDDFDFEELAGGLACLEGSTYEDLEGEIDFPDDVRWCVDDCTSLYFSSAGSMGRVVEVKGDFAEHAHSDGIWVDICDGFGEKVRSQHIVVPKGQSVDMEVGSVGFEEFSGRVVSQGEEPIEGAEFGVGAVFGAERSIEKTDSDGHFSFRASARSSAVKVTKLGFVDREVTARELRSREAIVLETAREVLIYLKSEPESEPKDVCLRVKDRKFQAKRMEERVWRACGVPMRDAIVCISRGGLVNEIPLEDGATLLRE